MDDSRHSIPTVSNDVSVQSHSKQFCDTSVDQCPSNPGTLSSCPEMSLERCTPVSQQGINSKVRNYLKTLLRGKLDAARLPSSSRALKAKPEHPETDLKAHAASSSAGKDPSDLELTPYGCSVCNRGFMSLSMLNIHLKVYHSEDGQVAEESKRSALACIVCCMFCEQTFAKYSDLDGHTCVNHLSSEAVAGGKNDRDLVGSSLAGPSSVQCGKVMPMPGEVTLHKCAMLASHSKQAVCDESSPTVQEAPSSRMDCELLPHTSADGSGREGVGKQMTSAASVSRNTCNAEVATSCADRYHNQAFHEAESMENISACDPSGSPAFRDPSSKDTSLICGPCGQLFKTAENMHDHKCSRRCETEFACTVCPMKFKLFRSFRLHMKTIHQMESFLCSRCSKVFPSEVELNAHPCQQNRKRPHLCDTCGKSYKTAAYLATHKLSHLGIRPHKCVVCGKSFTQPSNLQTHMRIHRGERPFACKVCGKSFRQLDHLMKHGGVHTKDAPYACETCGKRFRDEDYVKKHMRIHTGDMPFQCKDCGVKFRWGNRFAAHKCKPDSGADVLMDVEEGCAVDETASLQTPEGYCSSNLVEIASEGPSALNVSGDKKRKQQDNCDVTAKSFKPNQRKPRKRRTNQNAKKTKPGSTECPQVLAPKEDSLTLAKADGSVSFVLPLKQRSVNQGDELKEPPSSKPGSSFAASGSAGNGAKKQLGRYSFKDTPADSDSDDEEGRLQIVEDSDSDSEKVQGSAVDCGRDVENCQSGETDVLPLNFPGSHHGKQSGLLAKMLLSNSVSNGACHEVADVEKNVLDTDTEMRQSTLSDDPSSLDKVPKSIQESDPPRVQRDGGKNQLEVSASSCHDRLPSHSNSAPETVKPGPAHLSSEFTQKGAMRQGVCEDGSSAPDKDLSLPLGLSNLCSIQSEQSLIDSLTHNLVRKFIIMPQSTPKVFAGELPESRLSSEVSMTSVGRDAGEKPLQCLPTNSASSSNSSVPSDPQVDPTSLSQGAEFNKLSVLDGKVISTSFTDCNAVPSSGPMVVCSSTSSVSSSDCGSSVVLAHPSSQHSVPLVSEKSDLSSVLPVVTSGGFKSFDLTTHVNSPPTCAVGSATLSSVITSVSRPGRRNLTIADPNSNQRNLTVTGTRENTDSNEGAMQTATANRGTSRGRGLRKSLHLSQAEIAVAPHDRQENHDSVPHQNRSRPTYASEIPRKRPHRKLLMRTGEKVMNAVQAVQYQQVTSCSLSVGSSHTRVPSESEENAEGSFIAGPARDSTQHTPGTATTWSDSSAPEAVLPAYSTSTGMQFSSKSPSLHAKSRDGSYVPSAGVDDLSGPKVAATSHGDLRPGLASPSDEPIDLSVPRSRSVPTKTDSVSTSCSDSRKSMERASAAIVSAVTASLSSPPSSTASVTSSTPSLAPCGPGVSVADASTLLGVIKKTLPAVSLATQTSDTNTLPSKSGAVSSGTAATLVTSSEGVTTVVLKFSGNDDTTAVKPTDSCKSMEDASLDLAAINKNPVANQIKRPGLPVMMKCILCGVEFRWRPYKATQKCATCCRKTCSNMGKSHICDICGKVFTQSGNLRTHLRLHAGDKPYECHICQKRFALMKYLNSHVRMHSAEKQFSCHVCGKKLRDATYIKHHMRVHTGAKPFQCRACKKEFRWRSEFRSHKCHQMESVPEGRDLKVGAFHHLTDNSKAIRMRLQGPQQSFSFVSHSSDTSRPKDNRPQMEPGVDEKQVLFSKFRWRKEPVSHKRAKSSRGLERDSRSSLELPVRQSGDSELSSQETSAPVVSAGKILTPIESPSVEDPSQTQSLLTEQPMAAGVAHGISAGFGMGNMEIGIVRIVDAQKGIAEVVWTPSVCHALNSHEQLGSGEKEEILRNYHSFENPLNPHKSLTETSNLPADVLLLQKDYISEYQNSEDSELKMDSPGENVEQQCEMTYAKAVFSDLHPHDAGTDDMSPSMKDGVSGVDLTQRERSDDGYDTFDERRQSDSEEKSVPSLPGNTDTMLSEAEGVTEHDSCKNQTGKSAYGLELLSHVCEKTQKSGGRPSGVADGYRSFPQTSEPASTFDCSGCDLAPVNVIMSNIMALRPGALTSDSSRPSPSAVCTSQCPSALQVSASVSQPEQACSKKKGSIAGSASGLQVDASSISSEQSRPVSTAGCPQLLLAQTAVSPDQSLSAGTPCSPQSEGVPPCTDEVQENSPSDGHSTTDSNVRLRLRLRRMSSDRNDYAKWEVELSKRVKDQLIHDSSACSTEGGDGPQPAGDGRSCEADKAAEADAQIPEQVIPSERLRLKERRKKEHERLVPTTSAEKTGALMKTLETQDGNEVSTKKRKSHKMLGRKTKKSQTDASLKNEDTDAVATMTRRNGGKSIEGDSGRQILNKKETRKSRASKEVTKGPVLRRRNRLECALCGKKFLLASLLRAHMREHRKDKNCQCPVCFKVFSRPGNLVPHMLIHADIRPFACDICGLPFRQRHHLSSHMRVHSQLKKYECTFCHKKLRDLGYLRQHLRIHTGEMPYECQRCGLTFRWKALLRSHKCKEDEAYAGADSEPSVYVDTAEAEADDDSSLPVPFGCQGVGSDKESGDACVSPCSDGNLLNTHQNVTNEIKNTTVESKAEKTPVDVLANKQESVGSSYSEGSMHNADGSLGTSSDAVTSLKSVLSNSSSHVSSSVEVKSEIPSISKISSIHSEKGLAVNPFPFIPSSSAGIPLVSPKTSSVPASRGLHPERKQLCPQPTVGLPDGQFICDDKVSQSSLQISLASDQSQSSGKCKTAVLPASPNSGSSVPTRVSSSRSHGEKSVPLDSNKLPFSEPPPLIKAETLYKAQALSKKDLPVDLSVMAPKSVHAASEQLSAVHDSKVVAFTGTSQIPNVTAVPMKPSGQTVAASCSASAACGPTGQSAPPDEMINLALLTPAGPMQLGQAQSPSGVTAPHLAHFPQVTNQLNTLTPPGLTIATRMHPSGLQVNSVPSSEGNVSSAAGNIPRFAPRNSIHVPGPKEICRPPLLHVPVSGILPQPPQPGVLSTQSIFPNPYVSLMKMPGSETNTSTKTSVSQVSSATATSVSEALEKASTLSVPPSSLSSPNSSGAAACVQTGHPSSALTVSGAHMSRPPTSSDTVSVPETQSAHSAVTVVSYASRVTSASASANGPLSVPVHSGKLSVPSVANGENAPTSALSHGDSGPFKAEVALTKHIAAEDQVSHCSTSDFSRVSSLSPINLSSCTEPKPEAATSLGPNPNVQPKLNPVVQQQISAKLFSSASTDGSRSLSGSLGSDGEVTTLSPPTDVLSSTQEGKTPSKDASVSVLCGTCGKTFPSKYALGRHMRAHSKPMPYRCADCDKGFYESHLLEAHKLHCSGYNPRKCTTCGKVFSQTGNCRKHMLIHQDARPFECEICKKRFRALYHLQCHMITHNDARPYSCELCGKTFRDGAYIKKHMRLHTGELPYKCEYCGESFRWSSVHAKHVSRVHGQGNAESSDEPVSAQAAPS